MNGRRCLCITLHYVLSCFLFWCSHVDAFLVGFLVQSASCMPGSQQCLVHSNDRMRFRQWQACSKTCLVVALACGCSALCKDSALACNSL
jgi:hypothetical protein